MTRKPTILAALLMAACSATASEEKPAMTTAAVTTACDMTLDFADEAELSQWRTVLDGVMGGRSTGTRYAEKDHMVFRGEINTNGGGFSSLRRPMQPGDMAGADAITMRIRPDDRTYKLTFRTSERFRGRPVSYQADIPAGTPGEWSTVTVPLSGPLSGPLSELATSVFRRDVPAAPFDPSDVREMGIIIADGIDGPFRLDVREMGCGSVTA